jgi:hypothetical protein
MCGTYSSLDLVVIPDIADVNVKQSCFLSSMLRLRSWLGELGVLTEYPCTYCQPIQADAKIMPQIRILLLYPFLLPFHY